ncbi:precorrin-8X methylmutase [Mycoplasma sp. P36-A1]|uniref:precorrin-8X methylmutase n=1 Tax=Mycoplasma sp. P36-A1 TaxID=3252900 RepID=UPI003C2BDD58
MIEKLLPMEIENKSFQIIKDELTLPIDESLAPIIYRCIHTSADFDYAKNLEFSKDLMNQAIKAITDNAIIVTDTNMAKAGINKKHLEKLGGKVLNYISDEDVAKAAKENKTTRSAMAMKKAAQENKDLIFVVGNAPTALIEIHNMVVNEGLKPKLVIAVPVGFVNVIESKQLIKELDIPYVIASGRKGGSNIAAAIVNAIMYSALERE